jgi:beta-galactosidase
MFGSFFCWNWKPPKLLTELIEEAILFKSPDMLFGDFARQIDKNHYLYLSVSNGPKEIKIIGKSRSILFDKDYSGNFPIAPFGSEFIDIK